MPNPRNKPRRNFYQFLKDRLGEVIPPSLLPRRLRIYGHVAILWLNPDVLPFKESIGQAVMEFNPRIRSVLRRTAEISGPFRQPATEIIAGSNNTETSFRENHCVFHLDPMKVMFSLGNKTERMRISRLGTGEFIVDMFAGIGQFSIPLAVHASPKVIHAIEWNPDAFHYLQKNIRENCVTSIVNPHFGDSKIIATEISRGQADRVLMGLVQGTEKYIIEGITCLRRGGLLHFHEIVPRTNAGTTLSDNIKRIAMEQSRHAVILETRIIKSYNPQLDHVVLDVQID